MAAPIVLAERLNKDSPAKKTDAIKELCRVLFARVSEAVISQQN